jgi:hypothetical protein
MLQPTVSHLIVMEGSLYSDATVDLTAQVPTTPQVEGKPTGL